MGGDQNPTLDFNSIHDEIILLRIFIGISFSDQLR
ncbi:MAG: hypothetical protein RI909_31 [Bacteroidota bacterium]|jgi:hypothetical protein